MTGVEQFREDITLEMLDARGISYMKISLRHLTLFAFMLVPVAVYSQGSGSTEPVKTGAKKRSNFVVTRSVSGAVDSASDGSVVVKTNKGKTTTLIVTKKTRVGSGCMTVGRNVTVTYTAKDRKATAVRCK